MRTVVTQSTIGVDENVVDIGGDEIVEVVAESPIDVLLKSAWGVRESKWRQS